MAHHVHWLCMLAFLVAVFASWVLLTVMQRYHEANGRMRRWWLTAGSAVMGTGIWAMHFTGMLAFSLPVPVAYDSLITLISVIPAILASGCFLVLYRPVGMDQARMGLIAMIMAVGIGTMHYVGMEAMVVPADMYYRPMLFVLSIVAALVLAWFAVFAQARLAGSRLGAVPTKLLGSVALGLAVTLMHFIAMGATFFQPNAETVIGEPVGAPVVLLVQVLVITGVLFLFASISSIVDRRMGDIISRLEQSEGRFQSLAESTHSAIFTFDADRVRYANPALCRITGRPLRKIYEMRLGELFDGEFESLARIISEGNIESHQAFHREMRITTASGEEKWLFCSIALEQIGETALGLASAFDITEQKRAELEMRKLAYFDPLTQLHNRTVFMDRLQHCLDLLHRSDDDSIACVMILDLDGFKLINDSYGHLEGDRLLKTVASRLKALARSSDTMSRFGGDEFVLLLEGIDGHLHIDSIAERVLRDLASPIRLAEREIEVLASLGVVELNAKYQSPDQVLHDADVALYRAKELGGGRWVMFDHHLGAAAMRERTLLPELKQAIGAGALKMYYQPICGAHDGRVCGFEALARWQRDNGEWVSPDEFIPLAEDAGLIHEIGLWAVRSAASRLDDLNRHTGTAPVYISINIDADTLGDSRFGQVVTEAVQQHELAPGQLRIELTERGLIKDTAAVIPQMRALIDLGCEFMIDDFGTGYSSLAYLHQFPVKTLKIDRTFVLSLSENQSSWTVVKTIIALAESLGLSVVAEGVETENHVNQLAALHCHQLQGYYFSKPMPAEDVAPWLTERMTTREKVVPLKAGV